MLYTPFLSSPIPVSSSNAVTFFQFMVNPVPAAEGVLTPDVDVCVELESGSPTTSITLMLDPTPNVGGAFMSKLQSWCRE